MFALAAPLVLTELGWMAMGVVDILVVGRLPDSAAAIGAAAHRGTMGRGRTRPVLPPRPS